jgi:hypothetical protein
MKRKMKVEFKKFPAQDPSVGFSGKKRPRQYYEEYSWAYKNIFRVIKVGLNYSFELGI